MRTDQQTKCLVPFQKLGARLASQNICSPPPPPPPSNSSLTAPKRFYYTCFGYRVSAAFYLMCVQIISCSIWVAEWPPFVKELRTLLIICTLCILTFCNFSCFPCSYLRLALVADCFA